MSPLSILSRIVPGASRALLPGSLVGRACVVVLALSPLVAQGLAQRPVGDSHAAVGPIQHHTKYSPVLANAPHGGPVMSPLRNHEGPVRLAVKKPSDLSIAGHGIARLPRRAVTGTQGAVLPAPRPPVSAVRSRAVALTRPAPATAGHKGLVRPVVHIKS